MDTSSSSPRRTRRRASSSVSSAAPDIASGSAPRTCSLCSTLLRDDDWLSRAVEAAVGGRVHRLVPLSGGDVAQAFRAELDGSHGVFVKTHRAPPPGFFTTEAAGLEWLRAADAVRVPRVVAVGDDPPYLVLEWVDEGRPVATTDA